MPERHFDIERKVNDHGTKARRKKHRNHDPADAYSDWHLTLPPSCCMTDLDSVEYRYVNGQLRAVAVIESTFYEATGDDLEFRQQMVAQCFKRFRSSSQFEAVALIADALRSPLYLSVIEYRRDGETIELLVFSVCRLRDEQWRQMTEPQYRTWVTGLH